MMTENAGTDTMPGTHVPHGSGAGSSAGNTGPGSVSATRVREFLVPITSPTSHDALSTQWQAHIKKLEMAMGTITKDYIAHNRQITKWSEQVDALLRLHDQCLAQHSQQLQLQEDWNSRVEGRLVELVDGVKLLHQKETSDVSGLAKYSEGLILKFSC